MITDFALDAAPIVTYKLIIFDRYSPTVLLQAHLTFSEGKEPFSFKNELPQLKEHLSNLLDQLPKEKWSRENVLHVVNELMCESICSLSSHEIPDNTTPSRLISK